jgi:organic radical activating enzyme
MNDFTLIPFQNIVKFGQRSLIEHPVFNVSWILGRFCNYNCSYCWPYARTDKPDHQELEIYKKTIDSIKQQARANGFSGFHFSFSGGEPTAYKKLIELIKHYEDYESPYLSIHMTTNLSPNRTWWQRWLDATHVMDKKSITASYHAEFADENEFADKCLFLMENDVAVTINQVMVPELFDEYYNRCKRFWDKGINVTLKPQSDPTASYVVDGYTEEQKQILQTNFPNHFKGKKHMQVYLEDAKGNHYGLDQAERMNAFGFNKFKGWSCNAGFQSVIIRGNEVKRSYSCSDQPLGTLTTGFELFKKPTKCITDTCVSSADSKIPKVKHED